MTRSEYTQNFYPFTLYASHQHGGVAGDFHRLWMKTKPADMTWYAAHVQVLSRTEIRFDVYGMEDNFYGGIGGRIGEFRATCAEADTAECRMRRAVYLAEQKRGQELQDAEDRIIASYANEILEAS